MTIRNNHTLTHPNITRREALQVGAIGLMGLGVSQVAELQALGASDVTNSAKSVIFVFLNGGISQQDSFDPKPDAPANVRGEFQPIATRTPGLQICEHLPLLADRSEQYALVRSVATESSGHEVACHMLFTGRLDLPVGFRTKKVPSANEWPSIASQVTYALHDKTMLPPAAVLPQPSVNEIGRFRPGQYAGRLGPRWEAWHLNIAAECARGNGACPDCFRFDGSSFQHAAETIFSIPHLALPDGGSSRFKGRVRLMEHVKKQRRALQEFADTRELDRHQRQAISVLTDPKTSNAFEVENADPATLERYGKNKFGLSLLMAYRLVASGVKLVQVNLGKNSSWDTHDRNFVNLRENLLPPTDRALSALLDDLIQSGMVEDTLLVVTGEFGRTPTINKKAGRDHWGPVMTQLYAGAGVRGGNVIGATDKIGGYPIADKQTTENFAATIYNTLGIPRDTIWHDFDGRPYEMYCAAPIAGLI